MAQPTNGAQSSTTNKSQQLTQPDIDHFMQHGWLKLEQCFTRHQAEEVTANIWTRLGMDPNDKSTWHTERTNMPDHGSMRVSEFAPKAWKAICEIVGGEERIPEWTRWWKDSFIVNLGTPEGEGKDVSGRDLPGWHVDGDFFVHYLDSPEQALLVIPLFTDIAEGGGGTMICPSAMPIVGKHLYDNADGVSPYMVPRSQDPSMTGEKTLSFFNDIAKSMPDSAFVEATGKAGDVYLLHPLMLHSASNNKLRNLRIITNPPVSLNEPFQFDRKDSDYSLVEMKTRQVLGEANLKGWKITGTRDTIVPARLRAQAKMKEDEVRRLEEVRQMRGQIASVGVNA